MQDTAAFWDKISEKYAKTPISNEEAYQLTLNKTRGYLKQDDLVLEVGCGTGSTALLLAGDVRQIVASDYSDKMLDVGRRNAQAQNIGNVKFVQADVCDAVLAGESYDAVLAHNILHLLEDIPAAISTIHERLKPGGFFISKTVCQFGAGAPLKWRLMKLILPLMQMIGKAPYVNFMTVQELEGLITDGGFRIVESGNYPKTHISRYIVAQKL